MYTVYYNESVDYIFFIGILNRTLGGIDKAIGTIVWGGNLLVTPISAYDITQNIFYSFIQSV